MLPQITPEQLEDWIDAVDFQRIVQRDIADGTRNPDGSHKWERILAEIGAVAIEPAETDHP